MSDVRGVTEVNGIKEYRYFAGGEWRTAENHKLFANTRSDRNDSRARAISLSAMRD
jgi:hypothetical protein